MDPERIIKHRKQFFVFMEPSQISKYSKKSNFVKDPAVSANVVNSYLMFMDPAQISKHSKQ